MRTPWSFNRRITDTPQKKQFHNPGYIKLPQASEQCRCTCREKKKKTA